MTHTALINPPPDVQHAVAAVIQACRGWQPTPVPDLPGNLPYPPNALENLCRYALDPNGYDSGNFWATAIIVVLITSMCFAAGIHRIPFALFRLGRYVVRRLLPSRT